MYEKVTDQIRERHEPISGCVSVCVFMGVSVYVSIHVCMRELRNRHGSWSRQVCTHMLLYISVHACISLYVCERSREQACIHVREALCVGMCLSMYVCMWAIWGTDMDQYLGSVSRVCVHACVCTCLGGRFGGMRVS